LSIEQNILTAELYAERGHHRPSTSFYNHPESKILQLVVATKAHTDLRFAYGDQNSVFTRFCYRTMQAAGNSHTKSWKCQHSQHWSRRVL